MQIVGGAGIPACGIATRYSASYGCLQWCGQECPHLLQLAFSSHLISFDTPSIMNFELCAKAHFKLFSFELIGRIQPIQN